MSIPCGTDIPSILEIQLRKSVEMTRPPGLETNQAHFVSNNQEVDDALPRLKALLADTKAMVVQAESLVASMREPANYFRRY